MRRLGVTLIVLSACGRHPAPPPSAPVTVDVAPAAPITSGPLAQIPPPAPTPSAVEVPLAEPIPTRLPPPGGAPPFDRGAAALALGSAQIQRCLVPGGPTGPGHVMIQWDPSGRVSSATIDQGPLVGTVIGACLEHVYSTATVPPFAGAPVRVGKSFVLQ